MVFTFLIIVILGIQNVFATLDSPPSEDLEKARNTIEPALQVIDRSPYDIWNEHDLVIDGTTISSMPQKTHPVTLQYEIQVNEYFKPIANSFKIITAIANETSVYFEPDTRALFYLKKIEGGYKVSTYSVKTTQNCGARDLIQISPVLPNDNSFVRGAPMVPWTYKDLCVPDYYSYDPDFWTSREYKPPLKQYEDHNLPIQMQMCDGNFVPVIPKSNTNHIACVRERSLAPLIEREWASLPRTIMANNAKISIPYLIDGGNIISAAAYGEAPNKNFKPGPGIIGPDQTNGLFVFIFSLQTPKDGKLLVTIPKEITGSIAGEETVLVDGEEIDYHQIISPSTRTLIIDFTNGTGEIQILGSGYYEGLPLLQ